MARAFTWPIFARCSLGRASEYPVASSRAAAGGIGPRRLETQGPDDIGAHERLEAASRDGFGDLAEQGIRNVRIAEPLGRLAKGRRTGELSLQRRAIRHGLSVPGVGAVTNDAAGVHEEVANREVGPERLLRPREVRHDRVVESQLAALDELHDDRCSKGLRDGGAAKRC
jgi:hypothetical protein